MRIDGPLPFAESAQSERAQKSGISNNSTRLTPADNRQDQTFLSVDSKHVEQLKATISQLPDIRQERVSAVRGAIENGSFKVSDQQLADSIQADLGVSGTRQ